MSQAWDEQSTFYKWKAKYAELTLTELKRLRYLEEENRRLKQIVAQQALDNWSLKEFWQKLLKPKVRRISGVIRHGGSWVE